MSTGFAYLAMKRRGSPSHQSSRPATAGFSTRTFERLLLKDL